MLAKFIEMHGPFKVDEQDNLVEDDFLQIYDLIESMTRFELLKLRTKRERSRNKLFIEAFYNDELRPEQKRAARMAYVVQLQDDISHEIELYEKVKNQILKEIKVNERFWNSSIEEFLPAGQKFVERFLHLSMSSPFTFSELKSESELI